jgi:hypothetical protein
MRISSKTSDAITNNSPQNRPEAPMVPARTPTQSLGQLSGLSAINQRRSDTDRSSFKADSARSSFKASTGQTSAPMGAGPTPIHAGTRNDCGLHTIAALTGWSEQTVCQQLGLTQQHVEWISANGMQPDLLSKAFQIINNGNVAHRQGPPDQLIRDLSNFPDGHQFALGIQRGHGIGHLVSARRIGNSLEITDRQIGARYSLHSAQDLANYLHQEGAAQVHTWYNS